MAWGDRPTVSAVAVADGAAVVCCCCVMLAVRGYGARRARAPTWRRESGRAVPGVLVLVPPAGAVDNAVAAAAAGEGHLMKSTGTRTQYHELLWKRESRGGEQKRRREWAKYLRLLPLRTRQCCCRDCCCCCGHGASAVVGAAVSEGEASRAHSPAVNAAVRRWHRCRRIRRR